MGGGTFDPGAYRAFASSTVGKATEEIYSSRTMNKNLNPHGVKIRESRDSADNPNSTPLIVGLDVTGSMGIIADVIAREGLGTLFTGILERKPITDPHVMFMAIGDANCDQAPLQVSQFEADKRIIEQLTQIYLEHGGVVETTKHLVHETHAKIGYSQSDEISLVWLADGPDSDVVFSGKLQKMTSVLASMAASKFARVCPPGYEDRMPHFDCRVFQLPSKEEAANAFLWRAMDARKNAISMVVQSKFSHKKLHGMDQKAMLAMLKEIGVEFEDYPEAFRRGSFVRRFTVERLLTDEELARIPAKHRPTGPVMRNEMRVVPMPPFNKVSNRVAVIFDGADPARS